MVRVEGNETGERRVSAVDTGVVVNPWIVLGRCPAWDVAVRYRYNDPKHISVHPSLRNRTARCSRWIRRRHGSAGAWRRRRAATHDIGLVDPPAVSHGAPAGTGGVGQQWREPLHPAVDGDMVDLDAALSQEFLDVAIRQPEAQYQRTASTMMSGGKPKPAKADRAAGPRPGRVLMPAVLPLGRAHGERSSAQQAQRSTTR
jgi:hypothetical protein